MNVNKMQKFANKDLPLLFPCMIISTDGTPLGLTYSDLTGIKETVDTRSLVLYSRDRSQRWHKGETSGNFQKVIHVSFNCDRTSLLYIVDGGDFCHLGNQYCFNCREPSKGGLLFIEKILKKSIYSTDSFSYTKKLFPNKTLQL